MSALYDVQTERFGIVQVERDNIEEARRWAREALDVRNPRCVTRTEVYIQCSRCDSAPCACEKRS
jgi:hypothetical protein